MAAAALRPGCGPGVGQQQHERVRRLDLVQAHGNAACRVGVAGWPRGQAGHAGTRFQARRVQHRHRADLPQARGQLLGEVGQRGARDAIAHRNQSDGHGPIDAVALARCLQAPHDLPRQGDGYRCTGGQQLVELGFAQAHQHRVANRHHGGRARVVGEQAHFANDLAARDLSHDALHPVFAGDAHAHAPTDQHEHRIAGLALRHQRLPTRQLQPGQLLGEPRHRGGLEIAKEVVQVLAQQCVQVGRAVRHVRARSPEGP